MKLELITNDTVTAVADLIEAAEQLQVETPSGMGTMAFRGQSQAFGTLIPSFRRKFEGARHKKAVEFIEEELIKAFRSHYAKLAQSMPNMPSASEIDKGRDLRCLSVMQHYGVPTRLLDWTTDLWTAVYFACAGDPDHDAELWSYDRELFRSRSATAAQEQDANLSNIYQEEFDPPILGRRDLELVLEVSQQLTPRMRQQMAHHTVASDVFADHAPLMYNIFKDSPDPDVQPVGFYRVILAQRCKDKVLKYLNEHKGMSASTIFPDFEGLGRFLRWQLDSLVTTLL